MSRKLSVIVPVYNAERHLRQCLDSILGQTYKNLEVIVVDDCSSDGSLEICREYAVKDARVRLVCHEVNGGTGVARASGVAAATGDYIGWVDSDDWVAPSMYDDMVRVLETNDADIVQCKYFMALMHEGSGEHKQSGENPQPGEHKHSGDCRILQTKDTGSITKYSNIEAVRSLFELTSIDTVYWNKVFRKSVFDGVDMSLRRRGLEDTDTLYKLLFNARNVIFIDKSYYYYRQHTGTHTGSTISAQKAEETIDADKQKIIFCEQKCPELLVPSKQKLLSKYISVYYTLADDRKDNDTAGAHLNDAGDAVSAGTADSAEGTSECALLKGDIAMQAASLYGEVKTHYPLKKRLFYSILLFSVRKNIIAKLLYKLIGTKFRKSGYRYSTVTGRWLEAGKQ